MQKEIQFLGQLVLNPERPFYAIIGGAKISSKIGVLHSLLSKVDAIFLGGGMAYTFFKIQGLSIGDSLFEESAVEDAEKFLSESQKQSISVFFPKDLVIANAFKENADHRTISVSQGIPQGWQGMDIGPITLQEWKKELTKAKTIFWNGPLGVFEFPVFAKGTEDIAKILAESNATTIVGGGDSIAAINSLNLSSSFTHLSTGGGASLEFIEYGHLPGIDVLSER
jgi:phosphoglycerate kinase